MRPRQDHAHHTGVHTREELEAEFGPVFDVRGFARLYILLGINGQRVTVRRKADGATGTLSFTSSPLTFFDFQPTWGGPRA